MREKDGMGRLARSQSQRAGDGNSPSGSQRGSLLRLRTSADLLNSSFMAIPMHRQVLEGGEEGEGEGGDGGVERSMSRADLFRAKTTRNLLEAAEQWRSHFSDLWESVARTVDGDLESSAEEGREEEASDDDLSTSPSHLEHSPPPSLGLSYMVSNTLLPGSSPKLVRGVVAAWSPL